MSDETVLDEIVAPLRVHLATLDEQVAAVTAERDRLLAQRAKVKKTLAFLDPEEPKPQPRSAKLTAGPERTNAVRLYLQKHAGDFTEGFTAVDLERQMEMNGGRIGPIERLRDALKELHATGVIRLDRRTKGGGRLYKLVAPNG
jgi:hypothetical protein